MALRILLRAGVDHGDVKESVWTKPEATAAVILGGAGHLPQATRRPAGVGAEIRSGLPFHHGGDDFAFLEDLVLQEVSAVLAKLRVKRQAKQSVGSAFVKDVLRDICEEGLGLVGAVLFEEPDLTGLMDGEERIADPGQLAEPDQAKAHVAGFTHEGMRK